MGMISSITSSDPAYKDTKVDPESKSVGEGMPGIEAFDANDGVPAVKSS
jgi:hypothetical protein